MNNYTIKPFDLKTALEHPDWVGYSDGSKPSEWKYFATYYGYNKIWVVKTNGSIHSYRVNGTCSETSDPIDHLVLHVPATKVKAWVVHYDGVLLKISTDEQALKKEFVHVKTAQFVPIEYEVPQ